MTHLNDFGGLAFCGNKAAQLIQGQTTADILKLDQQSACFSAFCSPKGRMFANGIMLKIHQDQLIFIASKVCLAALEQAMQRLLPFFSVNLKHIDKVYGCSAGTSNAYYPQGDLGISIVEPPPNYAIDTTDWLAQWWNRGVVFIRNNKQIEAYLPHEIGWDDLAISYTKGCYTGQEIIARVHYRGTPKTKFVLGKSAAGITALQLIDSNQQPQGRLIDSLATSNATFIAASVQTNLDIHSLLLDQQPLEWTRPMPTDQPV